MSDKNDSSTTTPIESQEEKKPESSSFLDMELPPVSERTVYHDDDLGDTPESITTESVAQSEATESVAQKSAEDYRGLKDDKGVAFDPSLHSSPPEKTPSGRWKRIPKRERESMAESGGPEIAPNADIRIEAQKAATLYASAHAIPFASDCTPEKDRFNMLVDAIEQYYNENGAIEISAGMNVLMTCGMYTQEVASRPTNIEKVKGWLETIKNKWVERKGKKAVARGEREKPKTTV